jgi:hypothetical protein
VRYVVRLSLLLLIGYSVVVSCFARQRAEEARWYKERAVELGRDVRAQIGMIRSLQLAPEKAENDFAFVKVPLSVLTPEERRRVELYAEREREALSVRSILLSRLPLAMPGIPTGPPIQPRPFMSDTRVPYP